MESIVWMMIAILLFLVAFVLAVYLYVYRKNIKMLNKQIKSLLEMDTNLLLTTDLHAKDWMEMVALINQSFSSVKELKRKMFRTNHNFRESITGISHDLRTPLTSAGGFVQILKKKDLDEEKRMEYVDVICERIQTVHDLLNQLFDYARMEANEMELTLERVNLTNLLCDSLSLYYQDFKDKEEEPNIKMPDEDVYVTGEEEALKRVLSNIIYNALVHGEGEYGITLEKKGGCVKLTCSNRTSTIREKDMEFLFDRFYTSDKSRNRRTTGLGLAVAKRLVELMGGKITAELKEGMFIIQIQITE